jgi:uncharacterized protein YxjI
MNVSTDALVPTGSTALQASPFAHARYVIKRPFFTLFGRTFRVYDPTGNLALKVRHPMRWRDAVKFYADEAETQPLLFVESRTVFALNRSYDIQGAAGEFLGTLRSRGLKSIVRDVWDLLDAAEQPIGLLQEDGASLLRRFMPWLTGKWHMELGGQKVADVRQVFRFFTKEFVLEMHGGVDPRLAMAGALLALMAEISREQRN